MYFNSQKSVGGRFLREVTVQCVNVRRSAIPSLLQVYECIREFLYVPLHSGRRGENSVFRRAGEILHSSDRAVVLPAGLIQFNPKPDSCTHRHTSQTTHKHNKKKNPKTKKNLIHTRSYIYCTVDFWTTSPNKILLWQFGCFGAFQSFQFASVYTLYKIDK